jgi:hypothetical protein
MCNGTKPTIYRHAAASSAVAPRDPQVASRGAERVERDQAPSLRALNRLRILLDSHENAADDVWLDADAPV